MTRSTTASSGVRSMKACRRCGRGSRRCWTRWDAYRQRGRPRKFGLACGARSWILRRFLVSYSALEYEAFSGRESADTVRLRREPPAGLLLGLTATLRPSPADQSDMCPASPALTKDTPPISLSIHELGEGSTAPEFE